jgi:AbrB family transcriptional regulator (stage V sporulation protein T)
LLKAYQNQSLPQTIKDKGVYIMKATGIVRRIDDLGRVVIPKEIRRTLRIREGDPLEIYTATDGEVIFKKYSPVGEMSVFATQYADVLSRISNLPTIICDRDHVIAVAGVSKREFLERRITSTLEGYIENRKSYQATATNVNEVQPVEGIEYYAAVIYPIIAAGDVTGAVVMLKNDSKKAPTDTEVKLAQSAAAFLGKQMEE